LFDSVHGVYDVWHTAVHTAEPLLPEPCAFEVELAIEKLKNHKSPGIDQIPVELRQLVEQFAVISIYLIFLFGIMNPEEWKESIIVPVYKKGDKTDHSNYRGISLLPIMYKIFPSSCSEG